MSTVYMSRSAFILQSCSHIWTLAQNSDIEEKYQNIRRLLKTMYILIVLWLKFSLIPIYLRQFCNVPNTTEWLYLLHKLLLIKFYDSHYPQSYAIKMFPRTRKISYKVEFFPLLKQDLCPFNIDQVSVL